MVLEGSSGDSRFTTYSPFFLYNRDEKRIHTIVDRNSRTRWGSLTTAEVVRISKEE
jgi:hypothetical protein